MAKQQGSGSIIEILVRAAKKRGHVAASWIKMFLTWILLRKLLIIYLP